MSGFGSFSQDQMLIGVAVGGMLLFVVAAALALLLRLYAKNRLARGIPAEPRRRPERPVRRRR